MKRIFFALVLLLALSAGAAAVSPLCPEEAALCSFSEAIPLYCGPTQGFYRHESQTIDLSKPFVCFGQYDCWVMAAQGTPEDFGPVGFIEGGLFDAPQLPELSFEEAFAAMIEEDAAATNDPLHEGGAWDVVLPRGTQITVLAGYGDHLYIQTEISGLPARVFIPAACVL